MAKVKINWPPMSMKAEGEDAAVLAQAEQFLKYVKEAHKISFDVLPTIFRDGCRDPEELDDEDDEDVEPLTEPEEVDPGAQWDVVAIYDNAGIPSIMHRFRRMNDKDLFRGGKDKPHPAFIIGGEVYVDGKWVGRHHHHIVMQHTEGLTREMVEKAWGGRGMARCEPLNFDHGYITGLAKYIVKNVRCKRHWRQSRGLKPPKMPRPNDGKMSRGKLKDVCENRLEDRAFWEKMYPGYTLHYCEPIITGNSTRHLIVRLYRKETGMKNRRNQP